MTSMNLHLSDVALDQLLNSTGGSVGRHMEKIAIKIYSGAHRMAGDDTGELKRKLYWRHRRGAGGRYQYVEVGSRAGHAAAHHEGTRPHSIIPDNGRLLRFNVGGRVVYAKKTLHPGTKPVRYLTVPMRRAVR